MRIIEPSVGVWPFDVEAMAREVRAAATRGLEDVAESFSLTARFVVDRGVSHELVRHRLASFSQESTRYCNYGADSHGGEVTFIRPSVFDWCKVGNDSVPSDQHLRWIGAMGSAEWSYLAMLKDGASPQEARSVLPNSTKTEVVMTASLAEWRLVFGQRTAPTAHPQMRQVMTPLHRFLCAHVPLIFDDLPFQRELPVDRWAVVDWEGWSER